MRVWNFLAFIIILGFAWDLSIHGHKIFAFIEVIFAIINILLVFCDLDEDLSES